MHDTLRVGVRDRGGHGRDRGDDLAGPQTTPPGQQCGEAAALEQVEDQRHPGGAAARGWCTTSMQPDQVRVVQIAEQHRLPRLPLGIAVDEELDRDRVTPAPRHRPPDLAGPPRPSSDCEHVARGPRAGSAPAGSGCGHDRGR